MITFVHRCTLKYLNKQETGGVEIDLWKFEKYKEIWNEFRNYYTKLIINDYATFFHEYSIQLEVCNFKCQF